VAQYHCHYQIFQRGAGRSAVAGASYRAKEKMTNEYDGVTHDYSKNSIAKYAAYRAGEDNFSGRKNEVVHSEVMLPENASQEFSVRSKTTERLRHRGLTERRKNIKVEIIATQRHENGLKKGRMLSKILIK